MSEMENLINKYFRPGRLPHIWCPGCGNGVITGAIVKAIDKQGLEKDDVAVISGIGCSSRSSGYLDFNTANTLHGRALPIATGVKMANPALHVIVCSGDGDCTAIGGQYSPMTPIHSKATTAPYYTVEPSFNLLDLAKAAGATYVARATTYHVPVLVDVIAKGIAHKGFSIIEAVSACPISFGRQNKMGGPAQMMAWQRDHGVMKAVWDRMDEEKKAEAIAAGKFPIGVLYENNDVMEYTKAYDQIIQRAQEGK